MMKWLATFMLVPSLAFAVCDPPSATTGMIGCWPTVTTMSGSDFIDIWQAGAFPASANKISKTNLFASPAPIGTGTPSSGAFTTLNATGGINQTISIAWSGGIPGTGNLGFFSTQTYSGSPAGSGVHFDAGFEVPLNYLRVTDNLTLSSSTNTAFAWALSYAPGGSSATGNRTALYAELVFNGPVPIGTTAGSAQFGAASFHAFASQNLGGTSLSPAGDVFGLGVQVGANAGATHIVELTDAEFDFAPQSGASYLQGIGIKLINFAPAGLYGSTAGNDGAFQISSAGGIGKWRDFGIIFGDPQAPLSNNLPVSTGGILIQSLVGTVTTGIDMSATTFSTAFLLGPAGFYVSGIGRVATPQVQAIIGSNAIVIANGQGNGIAQFQSGGTSAPSVFVFNAPTTGDISIDVGATPTGIDIGPAAATTVNLGNASSQTNIVGTLFTGTTLGTLNHGLTCAAGAPSASFATVNGIVTHC